MPWALFTDDGKIIQGISTPLHSHTHSRSGVELFAVLVAATGFEIHNQSPFLHQDPATAAQLHAVRVNHPTTIVRQNSAWQILSDSKRYRCANGRLKAHALLLTGWDLSQRFFTEHDAATEHDRLIRSNAILHDSYLKYLLLPRDIEKKLSRGMQLAPQRTALRLGRMLMMEPGLDSLTIKEISSAVDAAEEHGRVPKGYSLALKPGVKQDQACSASHAGSATSSGGSMSGGSDIEDTDLFEET